MQKIREYAEAHNVSYEAVRRQVVKYQRELRGHVLKEGRTQYLDDFAVRFLDEHREAKPVAVTDPEVVQELQALKTENERLKEEKTQILQELAIVQRELIAEKTRVQELQEEKVQLLEEKQQQAAEEPRKKWWEFWK